MPPWFSHQYRAKTFYQQAVQVKFHHHLVSYYGIGKLEEDTCEDVFHLTYPQEVLMPINISGIRAKNTNKECMEWLHIEKKNTTDSSKWR